MAAASYIQCTPSPATGCLLNSTFKHCTTINSLSSSYSFKPIPSYRRSFPRLLISNKSTPSRIRHLLLSLAELADSNYETYPDADAIDSNEVASIDTKLPRRSLFVQFTCGECGGRTDRLINRLANERGTVYVQCAGCEKYHILVDSLGLVVEYDFWDEMAAEINTDQVP